MNCVDVVAALIWDGEKFMICRRPPEKKRGLLWEFVGGKVEPGETPEQALIRECQEELAITVQVESPYARLIHEYPDLTIQLCLYRCTIAEGVPQLLEHVGLQWITPDEIPQYDFCPADETVLKMLCLEQAMRKTLQAQADEGYKAFQSKLLPTVAPERIIGVRTPAIRALAKQLFKQPDGLLYAQILTHTSFDEAQLHAFLLSEVKDYATALSLTEQFLPSVDNWATCDQLLPKAFDRHSELRIQCYRWMHSLHPYTVRFGIKLLMALFLDADFLPEDLSAVAAIRSDEYYVNMMIAWYFATALAKQEAATLPYLTERRLPDWVHRKTIQKAIESNRIRDCLKAELRTIR